MHVELKLTFNTRNQFPLMLVSWTGQSPRLSSCTLVTTVWSCFTKRRHSVSKHSTVSPSYYLWDTSKLPVKATRSNFINLRGHTVNHTQLPVGRNTSVPRTSLVGSLCVHQSLCSKLRIAQLLLKVKLVCSCASQRRQIYLCVYKVCIIKLHP